VRGICGRAQLEIPKENRQDSTGENPSREPAKPHEKIFSRGQPGKNPCRGNPVEKADKDLQGSTGNPVIKGPSHKETGTRIKRGPTKTIPPSQQEGIRSGQLVCTAASKRSSLSLNGS